MRSDVVGLVPLRSDVIDYVEETEWGTDVYQEDARRLGEAEEEAYCIIESYRYLG